jgi:hypothetical protein
MWNDFYLMGTYIKFVKLPLDVSSVRITWCIENGDSTGKTLCVPWLFETKSETQLQQNFHMHFGRKPPTRSSIRSWQKKFLEMGSVRDMGRSGQPHRSEENVWRVSKAFQWSPKSSWAAARELQLTLTTLHRVLHQRLQLFPYKVQVLQALEVNDTPCRAAFAQEMLLWQDSDDGYLCKILFSDEAIFHVSGKVNHHNVRIWGSENLHHVLKTSRTAQKSTCGAG